MNVDKKFKILVLTSLLFLFPVFHVEASRFYNNFSIRVALYTEIDEVKIYIPNRFVVVAPYTQEIIIPEKKKMLSLIKPTQSGLRLDKREYKIFGLKFVPLDKKVFFINNRPYRGEVSIIRTEEKKLLVINYVNISEYLKGVLYNEISHWWPMESLKAQAVAARTYVLSQSIKNKNKMYDVLPDVSSQVYGGKNSERIRTNWAVNSTKGEVLTFRNRIFPSFYHACSGGYTEDSDNVWDIDLPVLDGGKDNFSSISPYFNWDFVLSSEEIDNIIKRTIYKIGDIEDIFVLKYSSSGRVRNLLLMGEKRNYLISGTEFRKIFGYRRLKSTKFVVKKEDRRYVFEGHGWGHGVGMSQWGAYNMAKQGYDYKQILKYYYPGVEITTVDKMVR